MTLEQKLLIVIGACAVLLIVEIIILVIVAAKRSKARKRITVSTTAAPQPATPIPAAPQPETAPQKPAPPSRIFMRLETEAEVTHPDELYLEQPLSIGRGEDCDIRFAGDSAVSGMHAKLSLHDGVVYIQDCDSTNGTFVNGMRIFTQNKLRSGDEITVGDIRFKLKF